MAGLCNPMSTSFTCCPRCGYRLESSPLKCGPKKRPIPPDILEHFHAGENMMDLGARYGVGSHTARKWLKDLGIAQLPKNKRENAIPECVKDEYEAGATMSDLAGKYHSNIPAINQRLHDLKAKIRKPGKHRLNADEIAQILALDRAGEKHPAIGRQFGVTRERVRQLVAEHGQPSRWERNLGAAVDRVDKAHAAATARALERGEKLALANKLWEEGRPMEDIAALYGKSASYARNYIVGRSRKLGYFQYRRPEHHRIPGNGRA